MRKKPLYYILFVFLSVAVNSVYAQTAIYRGGILTYENKSNNIKKNIGKNVILTFDEVFNSYTVVYTNVYGKKQRMTFVHDGSPYDVYHFDGITFSVIAPGILPLTAKNGQGFITFSDLRKYEYGGTRISYTISKLKVSKPK